MTACSGDLLGAAKLRDTTLAHISSFKMATCKDCTSALVMDVRSGDAVCVECGLVQGGSLNVAECRLDLFHEGGLLEEVGYNAPPPLPGRRATWFMPDAWTPSSLPAICKKAEGEPKKRTSSNGDIRRIGKKVGEELEQVAVILNLLGLPGVEATARSYLKLCLSKRLQRGSARPGTVLACIFHACRVHDAPRTARELSNISKVPVGIIKDACKRTAPIIDGITKETASRQEMRPDGLLARCCSKIMSSRDTQDARMLLLKCRQRCASRNRLTVLQGKTPATVAAVVIFKVVQEQRLKISKREICSGCGINAGTLLKAITEYEEQVEEQPVRIELDLNL